jgi:methionyl-tRNA formyltransferase
MKVVYIGTGEFGIPSLQALIDSPRCQVAAVLTQPDRPAGRHQELQPSPVKKLAFENHLEIYQPEKINTPSVLAQLNYLKPDVLVVCAYGQILKRELLKLPSLGCLNIHGSLLPEYRGAACVAGPIRDGRKNSGITIMWMDEGLDTGDILLQDSLSLGRREIAGSLHDRLASLAAPLLLKSLALIENGKAPRLQQNHAKASYIGKLKKEDGKIDWKKTQIELDRQIRAMNPWPAAYTHILDKGELKTLKIFRTILSTRAKGQPGEVVRVDKHGILVACGKGGLLLREVQFQGRKRMDAGEFSRGFSLPVGALLE